MWRWVAGFVAFVTLGFLVMVEIPVSHPDSKEQIVKSRAKSPDGTLEAVYVEDASGGAATGATEDVFVTDGKGPLTYAELVFRETLVTNVTVTWDAPDALEISYDAAPGHQPGFDRHHYNALTGPPHGVHVRIARRGN